jgi:hypothetical protein
MTDLAIIPMSIVLVGSQVPIIVTQVAPVISSCGVVVFVAIMAQLVPVTIDFPLVMPYIPVVRASFFVVSSCIAVAMVVAVLCHHAAGPYKYQ